MSSSPDSTARAALAAGFAVVLLSQFLILNPPPPPSSATPLFSAQKFEDAGENAKAREAYVLAADSFLRYNYATSSRISSPSPTASAGRSRCLGLVSASASECHLAFE